MPRRGSAVNRPAVGVLGTNHHMKIGKQVRRPEPRLARCCPQAVASSLHPAEIVRRQKAQNGVQNLCRHAGKRWPGGNAPRRGQQQHRARHLSRVSQTPQGGRSDTFRPSRSTQSVEAQRQGSVQHNSRHSCCGHRGSRENSLRNTLKRRVVVEALPLHGLAWHFARQLDRRSGVVCIPASTRSLKRAPLPPPPLPRPRCSPPLPSQHRQTPLRPPQHRGYYQQR